MDDTSARNRRLARRLIGIAVFLVAVTYVYVAFLHRGSGP